MTIASEKPAGMTLNTSASCAMPWLDDTERLIAEVWERMLGSRRIDRNTSILNLRIGFLQIYRFLTEIETVTGVSLSLTTVFQAPTIPELADVVRSGCQPIFKPLISFRTGDENPPLFLLPGLGGSVFMLFDLARLINYPGRIYLNQQAGLDGRQPPHRTITDMVLFQLDAIRTVQPKGPYALLGYSLGGTLALEVARRLIAEGESVPFIGLVEPYLPERLWPVQAHLKFLMRRARVHGVKLHELSARQMVGYFGGRVRSLLGRVGQMLGKSSRWLPPREETLPPVVEELTDATNEAFRSYRIQEFDGKVSLFLSRIGDPLACDPMAAWPRYLANFNVVRVSGSHLTMVSGQNAKSLAAKVSDQLEQVIVRG